MQRTRVLQDGDAILEPGDEAAGLKRAVSWETLLTCCFTPHRLSSLWNGRAPRKLRACPPQASRPPQNASGSRSRACRKPQHASSLMLPRTSMLPIHTMRPSNRPDKNAPGGANANIKPKRFIAANSEPPRRTARCNHLMGLLMLSMPGKPRPASSSRRRAQGRSPPARCSSCQNRASWRAGPWCS